MKQDSHSSLQKALMRPGDHHLRRDNRQMFGNYVELSPGGGGSTMPNVRRSAGVCETPVYDAPKLWQVQLLFSAPKLPVPVPLSPWVPSGLAFEVHVTLRAALDRDKAVSTEEEILLPIGFGAGPQRTFATRFQAAQQLGLNVECVGTGDATQVLGVQASIVEVVAGERDPFGSAAIAEFQQGTVSQVFLVPNARRRQFFVQNWGTAPLFVAFDLLAAGPSGGPPSWTVALPSRGDIYESPRDCWQGYVSGVWSVDSLAVSDLAMVTEGT
jgi:hypothetical protein